MSYYGLTRRDNNEKEIVKALIKQGASVEKMHMKGVPDLLVGYAGRNYLLEVKSEKGKLLSSQKSWHKSWRGHCRVVRSIEEALHAISGD